MKHERKNLCILLSILLVIIAATIVLAVKMDKSPDMQSTVLPGQSVDFQRFNAAEAMNTAVEMLNSNEFTQAKNLLNNTIKQHPGNTELWMLLGTVYYRQENFVQAEQAFRHVVRRQPDSAAGFNNLCETLIKLERFPEAKAAITKALRLAPKQGEILLNAASLHALLHEDKQALHFLKLALDTGITPEEISEIKELVHLLERPDFMNYYNRKRSELKNK